MRPIAALRAGADPDEVLSRLCAAASRSLPASAVLVFDAETTPRAYTPTTIHVGQYAAPARRAIDVGQCVRSGPACCLPLPGMGGTPGALVAVGRRRPPHPRRLEPFAAVAALALGPASSTSSAARDSAARERERLARELHDSVVQTLYGISLGAGTVAEMLHGDPAHARASLAWIQETASAGLSDLRGMILRLRPETLVGAGLSAALNRLLETLHSAPGGGALPTGWGLQLDAEPAVSAEVEVALYRIALEALGNAARHAAASQVTLRLSSDDTRVVLEVVDDGVGFAVDGPAPGRLGLRSMRERAELVGGKLDVHSAPGAGTVVRATLPTSG